MFGNLFYSNLLYFNYFCHCILEYIGDEDEEEPFFEINRHGSTI